MRTYKLRGALRLSKQGIGGIANRGEVMVRGVNHYVNGLSRHQWEVWTQDCDGNDDRILYDKVAEIEASYGRDGWVPETRTPEQRLLDAVLGARGANVFRILTGQTE